MPRIRLNGIEMHYVEAGAGDPVVLVMGLGGDHLAWAFQVRALAERYRVITFDNRGVGQTDAPDAPFSIRTMAEDTRGLLDALGLDRVHVVGVSMGGMIAQELALAHPARVRSLHLGCTLARPDAYMQALVTTWRESRTRLPVEVAVRSMALWLFSPRSCDERPQFVETVIQTALANPHPQSVTGFVRQTEAVQGHDTLARLGTLRCPTLVSVGDEDILVPPRFSREVAAAIPGAALHTIPQAGHVHFWERADDFNALTLEFLAAT